MFHTGDHLGTGNALILHWIHSCQHHAAHITCFELEKITKYSSCSSSLSFGCRTPALPQHNPNTLHPSIATNCFSASPCPCRCPSRHNVPFGTQDDYREVNRRLHAARHCRRLSPCQVCPFGFPVHSKSSSTPSAS